MNQDPYIDRAMAVMRACLLALVSVVKCADLACTDAEPQSPRDVTPGYVGHLTTRYEPYGEEERRNFLQANLHFHLGAEHRSAGEYDQDPPTSGLESTVAPGLFCKTDGLTAPELADYTFEHCKNVSVGNTYEFHWVFSTGAQDNWRTTAMRASWASLMAWAVPLLVPSMRTSSCVARFASSTTTPRSTRMPRPRQTMRTFSQSGARRSPARQ